MLEENNTNPSQEGTVDTFTQEKEFYYHGVRIYPERDQNLTFFAKELLGRFYQGDKELSIQESFARAALAYSYGDLALAQRVYDYASKGWFMYASPVLSNAPAPGEKVKGLPISCFLSKVNDSIEGLNEHTVETRLLSVAGGGIGSDWSSVRSVSKKAPGPIPFLKTINADIEAYKQGSTRKGSYAAYMDVSHPDIEEFLSIRTPTGGDINRKCLNLFNAVNITDEFMYAVIENKSWDLIDPNDKTVRQTVNARLLWERILETRVRTGTPYLHFIDESNRKLPQPLKDLGLKINNSNLCSEIYLPTSKDRTAVCCLSSLNLAEYDSWKDTPIVKDLIVFLDNVLQFFIDNCPDTLHRARYSAMSERSLGLGTMGFHDYLLKHSIPWESAIAKAINLQMFEQINKDAVESSKELAKLRGEYPDGIGSGMRNAHLIAIAPNANSSIILGTSPSIEPNKANAFTHKTRAGTFLVKNKYLEKILAEKYAPKDSAEEWLSNMWKNIILNEGSVQQLDFMSEQDKEVFKTAFEIDQNWVVQHCSDRQPFVCQGQSLNVFFPAGADRAYVNKVHLKAWKEKLKGMYYLRTSAAITADKVSVKKERVPLSEYAKDSAEECLACEG